VELGPANSDASVLELGWGGGNTASHLKARSRMTLTDGGEDAYLVNAFGQNVLYVKANGYLIVISGVDPFNDLPTLKSFASAILGRI